MKRRAGRSRHIVSKLIAAVLSIAIVAAGGWCIMPLADQWLEGADRFSRTVVTSDEVNLRSGPGTSHDVIIVVPTGTELVAEQETVNGYAAVSVDGQRGWMATGFLTEPGVAYAAEYTEPGATEQEPEVLPTSAPVVEQPIPTSVPTVVPKVQPVVAGSTQVEREPQPGEKWIEVDRSARTVTLHNGEIIVATFDALIGKDLSADGYYSTALGTYYVHVKEKSLAETPFADGVYLTDFVGFDPKRSNGFHSPTRDEFGNVIVTGGTATLGCVRLSEADAVLLFEFAAIGMRVEVHD